MFIKKSTSQHAFLQICEQTHYTHTGYLLFMYKHGEQILKYCQYSPVSFHTKHSVALYPPTKGVSLQSYAQPVTGHKPVTLIK